VLTVGLRRMLWVAALLVLAEALPLTVRTRQTDRYFAWTIDVPVTAAFLGAAYLAAGVLEGFAARQRAWPRARLAVPGVWVFTTLTLLVTVTHLDAFHLAATSPVTWAVTWAWVAVYATVPPVLGVLWWRQLRAVRGQRPAPGDHLPSALRHALGAQGLVMAGAGGLLLARPDHAGWWPWPLTVLTAQAVGAWLVGLAVLALQAWWTDRLDATTVVFAAGAVLGVGQLVVVARFLDSFGWGDPAAWTYTAFVASIAAVGLGGTAAARRARGSPVTPGKATDDLLGEAGPARSC
jgi:hypothetical protein